ncbi:hypothetical protein ACTJJ0_33395 [Chitinophaga sp. 22321]|uniref:Lipocalin-like domain-containing protein n=1 Tax=Chitinophaga hostae TaxID=2831022 RepID=A0ABS5J9V1_9BACT|nr:hypothetical protein [Chitinophaga hostae]MBS0031981.1 hypothetical protein [Chitinophaga hostae]
MSVYRSLFLLVAFCATFASCNLEMAGPDAKPVNPGTPTPGTPPAGSAKVRGTWNYLGVTLKSTSSSSAEGITATLYTDYTTSDNKGVFVFDGKNVIITGLGYTMNGTMRTVMTGPGVPPTDMTIPIGVTLPPYNANSPYQEINETTIYLEKGFIEDPSGLGGTETLGGEAKLAFDGDNMTMTIDLSKVAVPVPGSTVSGSLVAKFTRKK